MTISAKNHRKDLLPSGHSDMEALPARSHQMAGTDERVWDSMIRIIRMLLLPIGYMVGIWMLSSLPGGSAERLTGLEWLESPTIQNVFHIPLFAGLAHLWAMNLRKLDRSRPYAWAAVVTIGYGVIDEWHQAFVPGRYASMVDVGLDGAGAGLAVVLPLLTSALASGGKKQRAGRII